MSKQIELHLHYPLVAHTRDLNAVFCRSRLCRSKDILPVPRARGPVGRARFLQTYQHTPFKKNAQTEL